MIQTTRLRGRVAYYDFGKLITLWHNSLTYNDPQMGQAARDIVEQEWTNREVEICVNCNVVVPETGLLAALGYRVGSTRGLEPKLRWAILERVYNAELPLVHSSSYMAEWGAPNSRQRRSKLVNTLTAFIESKNCRSIYGKAVRDWSADLEYLCQHVF